MIAILIPVGICLFCVLIHLRQRAQEKAFNKGYADDNRNANTFERNRDTVKTNSIGYRPAPTKEVQEVKVQENETQQNGRKTSKHEGEYYTNEPLDNYVY